MKTPGLKKIISGICLTACFSLSVFSVSFADAGDISAAVTYGYDNNAKAGRYLPLTVDFDNISDELFEGEIGIYSGKSGYVTYEFAEDIAIGSGEGSEANYYIPISNDADDLLVAIKDKNGEKVFEENIELNIDRKNACVFMGILCDEPENLEYMDNVSINYGLLKTKTFELDETVFPVDVVGLDQLDVIVITDYRIRDLSEEQTSALMNWVKDGGVLMLGTGERVDDTLGRFAPELLEDMYDDPYEDEVELMDSGDGLDLLDNTETLMCTDIELHGGNVIFANGGMSILSSVSKENGLIVVSSYDFADVSDFAENHPDFAGDLLSGSIGSERLTVIATEGYSENNELYAEVSKLTGTTDPYRVPPIGLYAFSIMAYIILAGPGLYIFLKQRELSGFYRIGVIVLSVCFTALIFIMGNRTRFKDVFYSYAGISDADEDKITQSFYINLRNPYDKDYSVSTGTEFAVCPVMEKEHEEMPGIFGTADLEKNIRIARSEGPTEISVSGAGAFESEYFELKKTVENETGEGFSGYVELMGNEISGELTNGYHYDMEDTVIFLYGKSIPVGEIKQGETLDLSGFRVINVPVTDSKIAAYNAVASENMKEEKSNVLAFYRDNYLKGCFTDARVLGFAKGEDSGSGILSDSGYEGYGVTVYTSCIPVSSTNGNEVYRSVLITEPVTVSGEYDYKTNSVGIYVPAVIEYRLGNDLDIRSMMFEWSDLESAHQFDGTIALYSYAEGGYEYIDKEKILFTGDELVKYLSPGNTVMIKYTYEGNLKGGSRAALPMVSVIGEEHDAEYEKDK